MSAALTYSQALGNILGGATLHAPGCHTAGTSAHVPICQWCLVITASSAVSVEIGYSAVVSLTKQRRRSSGFVLAAESEHGQGSPPFPALLDEKGRSRSWLRPEALCYHSTGWSRQK